VLPHNLTLRRVIDVPFPTARLASVGLQALSVDKELSPLVHREFQTVSQDGSDDDSVLRIVYKATTNRMLRMAVNAFMDSLHMVIEVMEALDVDVLEALKAG
jgi:EKC/KEOPS complex subunit PCC1/LAGE3